jgi:hypothetical protein
MSRTMLRRVERLEREMTPPCGKVHGILGNSDADREQQQRELEASDAWKPGDSVMAILLVAAENGKPIDGD